MWAAVRAAWEDIKGLTKRVGQNFVACVSKAFSRPWVTPAVVIMSVTAGLVSPMLTAMLVTLTIDDKDGHPITRLLMDAISAAGALAAVVYMPLLAIPLAMIPIGDLLNKWVDRVVYYYEAGHENATHGHIVRESQP